MRRRDEVANGVIDSRHCGLERGVGRDDGSQGAAHGLLGRGRTSDQAVVYVCARRKMRRDERGDLHARLPRGPEVGMQMRMHPCHGYGDGVDARQSHATACVQRDLQEGVPPPGAGIGGSHEHVEHGQRELGTQTRTPPSGEEIAEVGFVETGRYGTHAGWRRLLKSRMHLRKVVCVGACPDRNEERVVVHARELRSFRRGAGLVSRR